MTEGLVNPEGRVGGRGERQLGISHEVEASGSNVAASKQAMKGEEGRDGEGRKEGGRRKEGGCPPPPPPPPHEASDFYNFQFMKIKFHN